MVSMPVETSRPVAGQLIMMIPMIPPPLSQLTHPGCRAYDRRRQLRRSPRHGRPALNGTLKRKDWLSRHAGIAPDMKKVKNGPELWAIVDPWPEEFL
jgi:hypothetical protein